MEHPLISYTSYPFLIDDYSVRLRWMEVNITLDCFEDFIIVTLS